ncbi:tail assembly protein [Stenotrophomonas sp. GZD-301]|uniref:tail assembly protein n=1 Tax=Stenotrophomonas sp. GZD-301 TaxID=3404814 RepID=UPI003BB65771
MTERVRTVRLYGVLGARFGREFRLAVNSPREAAFALSMMVPGFREFMRDAKAKGMEFAVFIGRQNLRSDQVDDPPGKDDIRIAPVLVGSKRGGVLQTIVGAVLVVVGVVLNAYTGVSGTPFINLGISMMAGGVVQMLSSPPKGLGAKESPENTPSYSMDGTVNTQAQGGPVPVAYGGHDTKGMFVGSAVISGGIYAEDQQ